MLLFVRFPGTEELFGDLGEVIGSPPPPAGVSSGGMAPIGARESPSSGRDGICSTFLILDVVAYKF
jgi:hypothetical protein